MRIVIALGGNALLRRGDPLTVESQRLNCQNAAKSLAPIIKQHTSVITHGNGPQVGLLVLQSAAIAGGEAYPLDILDAETEGQIGYLIEQEMRNVLPAQYEIASLLTQIEVDPKDPAFKTPTKPIGPVCSKPMAQKFVRERGWSIARDGKYYRRVVPSPRPERILEMKVIELLVDRGIVVICAGGGGIPTIRREDSSLTGVEAVIDKDLSSSLLARELKADALLMLTDVQAVHTDWGKPDARPLKCISPRALRQFSFAPGTMDPKVNAAIEFVEQTKGVAAIGKLGEAPAILAGEAGTLVTEDAESIAWWS